MATEQLSGSGYFAAGGAALVAAAAIVGMLGVGGAFGPLALLLCGAALLGVGMWGALPIRRTEETRRSSVFVAAGFVLASVCVGIAVSRREFVFGEWDATVEVLATLMVVAVSLVGFGSDTLKRATGA